MKNFAIAALLMASTFSINAQVISEDDRDDFQNSISKSAKYNKHIADNHITDVKRVSYSKKHPEGIIKSETKYDSHGNAIENMQYNKHGKFVSHFKYEYNDSNRETSNSAINKKNKAYAGVYYSYDKSGNITQNRSWWKDTCKTFYNWIIAYDSRNNPTEAKFYYSKGKLDSRTVYEYYEDGSKKKTTTYNGKGKVTALWNYDCNPIGKVQETKMKDTSKICVHYETDKNGNPIKVKEEYTEGGGWLHKYRLRKISKYDKDNHFIELITTKMNGKETWHSVADFDAQGNQTEWRKYVPNTTNMKQRVVYTYNNSGDITQAIVYSKSSPAGSVIKFVYN